MLHEFVKEKQIGDPDFAANTKDKAYLENAK